VPVRKRGYASQRDNVSPIDVIARKRFVTNPVSVLFRDDGEREVVIGHADGSIVSPIYISQLWARKIAKTRLARLRFHDLRHAHATHLLANGVHPKVACERLGHSKVGITLDLYSHVIPGMQEDAAAMVDRALSKR
jgi:integrase